jgi:hypothetical protein
MHEAINLPAEHECAFLFFLINIYFQEAFSQSDFQKGPELNKLFYMEDMHILGSIYSA